MDAGDAAVGIHGRGDDGQVRRRALGGEVGRAADGNDGRLVLGSGRRPFIGETAAIDRRGRPRGEFDVEVNVVGFEVENSGDAGGGGRIADAARPGFPIRVGQRLIIGGGAAGPLGIGGAGVVGEERFGFDVELLYVAYRAGLKLKEIPVRWDHAEGSKISFASDSVKMLSEVGRIRQQARRGVYDRAISEVRALQ